MYTSQFVDTNELIMALRARKVSVAPGHWRDNVPFLFLFFSGEMEEAFDDMFHRALGNNNI